MKRLRVHGRGVVIRTPRAVSPVRAVVPVTIQAFDVRTITRVPDHVVVARVVESQKLVVVEQDQQMTDDRYEISALHVVPRFGVSQRTGDSVTVNVGLDRFVVQLTRDGTFVQQIDEPSSLVTVVNRHRDRHLVVGHCTEDVFDRKLWTRRSVGDHQPAS